MTGIELEHVFGVPQEPPRGGRATASPALARSCRARTSALQGPSPAAIHYAIERAEISYERVMKSVCLAATSRALKERKK